MKIGAIICTVNPYYQNKELDYLLRKAQVKALFLPGKKSNQEVVNRFSKILSKTLSHEDIPGSDPILLEHLVTLDGEAYSDSDLPEKYRGKLKHHQIEQLFQTNGDVCGKVLSAVSPDDPSVIMFTSGTTGKPKGAVLSQFTVLNNALLATGRFDQGQDHQVFCIPLPFFHSFAGIIGNLGMLTSPFSLGKISSLLFCFVFVSLVLLLLLFLFFDDDVCDCFLINYLVWFFFFLGNVYLFFLPGLLNH